MKMDEIEIKHIMSEVGSACLVAVSKRKPVSEILEAIDMGIDVFAENRVQEAEEKFAELKDIFKEKGVKYHFIGHLQSNKVKKAVMMFDLIQSVDSYEIAQKIDSEARKKGKVQDVLVQVNIGKESQKSGVMLEDADDLIKKISHLKNIRLNGLMCITPRSDDPEDSRRYFRIMHDLFKKNNFKILSMGMSNDYLVAIEEGSNMVRIGTKIFGKRE